MDLCKECHERAVFCKKRQLCVRCYHEARKRAGGFPPTGLYTGLGRNTFEKYRKKRNVNLREMEFVRQYFSHRNWLPQPVTFHLPAFNYTPDFFDGETNAFIEVVGTYQAFYANRRKYVAIRKQFPTLKFEVRLYDGTIVPFGEIGEVQLKSGERSALEQLSGKSH